MSTVKLVDENTNHPKVRAIFEDIPRFVDIERGETLPATEYVYRDDA